MTVVHHLQVMNLKILMKKMMAKMYGFKLKSDEFVAVNIVAYDYGGAWLIEKNIFLLFG